jgi:YwiC-like protein
MLESVTSVVSRPARAPLRRTLRRWIPQQHGAWAMLVVPFLAGACLGGWTGWHGLLFLAWLFAYCCSYHVQEYVRLRRLSRNPRAAGRHVAPLRAFGAAFLVAALPLAVARPWVVLAAAAVVPFFAVNVGYAYRNDERAALNDLAAVVPACGMLLVSYRLGAGALDRGSWLAAAAGLLYFAGTVLYVKTMLRERGSRGFRVASIAYHAAAVIVAALLDPWLALPFAGYLARALVLPGRAVKIHVVGAVEVVNSALLLLAVVLVF